ncbi:MAG: hypothetical protein QXS19_06480 [Candidatus Methanomethylicia archaeon]
MNSMQPIPIEELNILNNLRARFTIQLPYSKKTITIYEPTVRNKISMLNEFIAIINNYAEKQNDIQENLKYSRQLIKKLIEMAKHFIKFDDQQDKIEDLDIYEVINIGYLYFLLLANNWLLKVTTVCGNCKFQNKDTYIYKEEDEASLRKLHNIQGLVKLYDLKINYNNNFEPIEKEINLPNSVRILLKLSYLSVQKFLSNKKDLLIPEILMHVDYMEIYKDNKRLFVFDATKNSIELLADMPENLLAILKQEINNLNFVPISVTYDYICPNCGTKQTITFDVLNYFLCYLDLLDESIQEFTTLQD